jgi:hypothetical protein
MIEDLLVSIRSLVTLHYNILEHLVRRYVDPSNQVWVWVGGLGRLVDGPRVFPD